MKNELATTPLGARYAAVAIALHWLTAAAFAFQIGLGWRIGAPRGPQTFAVFQLHKSIGITILLLTTLRLGWRLLHSPPPFAHSIRPLERYGATIVHAAFYALLLCLPLSGWIIVSSSKVAIPTFLYATVPWPHVPGIAALAPSSRQSVNDVAAGSHQALVWVAIGAILLHVAGALKHQWFDHDDAFQRMAPVGRRFSGVATFCVVLGLLGFLAIGRTVPLAPIALAAPAARLALPIDKPVKAAAMAAMPQPKVSPTATSVVAVTPDPRTTPPAAASFAWQVREGVSSIRFHTGWSQGAVDGGFAKWRARITFDPAALDAAKADVTIDMASVTAADSEQQNALPEADWFAIATHPTATWRSARFKHSGGDRYVADGTLTIRGVARPMPLLFTLTINGDVATMSANMKIDRTQFGIGQGEWASTADLPALVSVNIAIKADRVPITTAKDTSP